MIKDYLHGNLSEDQKEHEAHFRKRKEDIIDISIQVHH